MTKLPQQVTPYTMAKRFVGVKEVRGGVTHPLIAFAHNIAEDDDPNHVQAANDDETPWCSSFVNLVMYLLYLPRSKSRMARSWLVVGEPVTLLQAEIGYDVVVLSRGAGPQPGADVLTAPGHVGLFAGIAGLDGANVRILGGNQGDSVSERVYPVHRVLGIRRI